MRRIGIILVFCAFVATGGFAASRTSVTPANNSGLTRAGTATQRVRTSTPTQTKTNRITGQKTKSRTATTQSTTATRGTTSRTATSSAPRATNVVARATTDTRTGAEYEKCKNAYFTCMDQFCQLKSDDFRRCSCSDRITKLQSDKEALTQAREQLTAFNENLDVVGKTAAQAAAMNTASDGENALTGDKSASKALLNAILNSIRGDNTRVENSQLSDLNSVDLSFDSANSFGTTDVGQAIASYNGTALYSAVYPQCRNAVKSSCNDASLQRAVNAYLMAIEQDCNTVQTAIQSKQKETHAAIRESSAMLDMARAENHQKHNSDDIATCIANVESAILSEEVCGSNYHKCLDNGEYIDVSTGAPIAGVIDFYKLGQMLTFNPDRNNADQKLAQNPANRTFVSTFEKRVKQFAEPALDKCYDDSKTVWNDYLNKAMLDIYYAQQSKVDEIKQGCFDFVSACYMNGSTAMTNAMQGLVAAQTTTLNPNILKLNQSLCSDYIASCNNMFDGKIIESYIDNRHNTDSLTACRAVVKQCFDNYGGLNYENFYNPYSGLFKTGHAPDWFSLYKINSNGEKQTDSDGNPILVSECAKQLAAIDACSPLLEQAFGGFDYYPGNESSVYYRYGYKNNDRNGFQERLLRSTGIATEVYNQIIDILQTQCSTLDGKFMNVQNLALYYNNYNRDNFCDALFYTKTAAYISSICSGRPNCSTESDYKYLAEPYSVGKSYKTAYTYWIATNSGFDPVLPIVPDDPGGTGGTTSAASSGVNDGLQTTPGLAAVTPKQQINIRKTARAGGGIFASVFGREARTGYKTTHIYENMCPRDYSKTIDTESWGACLCWENGGRRSNNGTSTRCVATFPAYPLDTYSVTSNGDGTSSAQQTTTYGANHKCYATFTTDINQDINAQDTTNANLSLNTGNTTDSTFELWKYANNKQTTLPTEQDWCEAEVNGKNQVCPFGVTVNNTTKQCKECPENWQQKTYNGTTKCCPIRKYTYIKDDNGTEETTYTYYDLKSEEYCCPTPPNNSNFTYTLNNGQCINSTDSTQTTPAVEARSLSSEIMGNKFPESGSDITVFD